MLGVLRQINKSLTKNDRGPKTGQFGQENAKEILRQVNKWSTKNDGVPKTVKLDGKK